MLDSISLGNTYRLSANVNPVAGSCLFEKSPEADISNALYGQFAGLLVKNSSSTYDSNQAKLKLSLRLHGHSPLVLVDGLPREVEANWNWAGRTISATLPTTSAATLPSPAPICRSSAAESLPSATANPLPTTRAGTWKPAWTTAASSTTSTA